MMWTGYVLGASLKFYRRLLVVFLEPITVKLTRYSGYRRDSCP